MILVSAVSFTGTWKNTFNSAQTHFTNFQIGLQKVNMGQKIIKKREKHKGKKRREIIKRERNLALPIPILTYTYLT
jgi:hypothetical protein